MFPLSKLGELSPRTRMRKIVRILQGMEVDMAAGRLPDQAYLAALVMNVDHPQPVADAAHALCGLLEKGAEGQAILRGLNSLRHALLRELHAEPSEWDLVNTETGILDRTRARVYPIAVYLEDIRSPFNVGSLFRTAEAFGAQRIILSPRTPVPTHPRAQKTAKGAEQALDWEVRELESLPPDAGIFALELGGTPLSEFAFPEIGMVLVGSEELGLSPEALRLADLGLGRVSIPLAGAKRSLNVSVAFGILMQAWHARLSQTTR
ncbi:MAG: TrmH family RNA methyltransferase [Spirochaetia bacterium]|jgi:TrmH family RNA methyltransferase